MSETKKTENAGKSPKKKATTKKTTTKKPQSDTNQNTKTESDSKKKSCSGTGSATDIIKKINDVVNAIENTPLKSFEKTDQGKIIKSFEKVIYKMIREINSCKKQW